jgi:hypothetical protein
LVWNILYFLQYSSFPNLVVNFSQSNGLAQKF